MNHASRSLYKKLVPLTGKCDCTDQADTAIADSSRGYLTGSSQCASAESEIESDDSIDIQRTSLGPSGAAHLSDRIETIKTEPRSTSARAKGDTNSTTQGHLQAYLEEALKGLNENKGSKRIKRSTLAKGSRLQELKIYTPQMSRWNRYNRTFSTRKMSIPMIRGKISGDVRWWSPPNIAEWWWDSPTYSCVSHDGAERIKWQR